MKKLDSEPLVHVGIVCSPSIKLSFNGSFIAENHSVSGDVSVSLQDGHVFMNDENIDGKKFVPKDKNATFTILNVEIGIGFHWDQQENQTFRGSLYFVVDGDKIWAVNEISVEEYLRSVISSEMSATSDIELLKAHAVTSRSWLMAQVWGKGKFLGAQQKISPSERICWRDREDHSLFDVCADDHCQRYQGIARISNSNVDKAIDATRGLLLTYNDEVCDARFSKCCGGQTELFQTCWDDIDHPYLRSFHDGFLSPYGFFTPVSAFSPLSLETNATQWILSYPDAFCNTTDASVLRQVLNNYDQKTTDFFRWQVTTSADELSQILKEKANLDLGQIINIKPLKRGTSGRIVRLLIEGTNGKTIIGKELEIRRLLSRTHLYSSAFVVDKSPDGQIFTFRGAGWGHGVGLCQIGAAVMAHKGFSFRSILYHYFRRAQIEKVW